MLEDLDECLPQIPGRPEVQQINPPPYKEPFRVEFGRLMPKPKTDKKKKKKKAKPPARKKDKKPQKKTMWADPPRPKCSTTLQLITKATEEMESSVFPENIR